MTGIANVVSGVLHELASNPALEGGLQTLFDDILSAFKKHAATTSTPIDDVIAKAASAAAPFVIAKYLGVPNGANGDK